MCLYLRLMAFPGKMRFFCFQFGICTYTPDCIFLNTSFFIPSNTSLDTVAAVVPRIIAVMKTHETSLSVQLEALRAILHFVVPGESQNRSYVEAMKLWLSRQCLKKQIVITRGRSFCQTDDKIHEKG